MTRKHRVLIDASPVTNRVDGLAVYIVNLIKYLPESSFDRFDYSVLLNPEVDWPDLAAAMQARPFREIRARIAHIGPKRDWDLRRFMKRHRDQFDLVHITSNNYPFGLAGGIATIHDVTFMRWFEGRRGIPGYARLARLYMRAMVRNALRRADAIITVSASVQDQVGHLFHATEAERRKLHVIHEGWEHLADYEQATCERPPSTGCYLFFLGTFRPHKNLGNLLEGFRLAIERIPADRKLVIGGSSQLPDEVRRQIESINAAGERVILAGYLSNACVREYYRHAEAFVFPSFSEGFGIPVLESFYYGTPLICANATALPEIAGDGALYFDPSDPRDIADAIVRFYDEPALRDQLIERGRERLGLFSWAKMARETVSLYERTLESRK